RLQVVEQPLELWLEATLNQHEVAPHVHDLWHVLDHDRARLHAGPAGRAVPENGVRDDVANKLEQWGSFGSVAGWGQGARRDGGRIDLPRRGDVAWRIGVVAA